ncbi:MAG: UPF0182 family protein [Gemmatimonadaceae bacterium]|nr:UPF0182 family protein [Gemmatimonadaceae bacterium]
MRIRGWLLIALATIAGLLLVGRTVTALMVDHAWFAAMGVPGLFWEQVIDSLVLQGGAWLAGSLFAWANLHAVRRTIQAVAIPSRVANIEFVAMVPAQRLSSATLIAALVIGAVLALPITNWSDLALARHGLPFGEIEGILDRDLGFYVYWLPLEETLYLWSLVAIVAMTALVLVLYALTRSLRLEGRRLTASNHVRRHLSALGAVVLLLLAWSYRLDAFDLLQQGSGPDGLFLHVDHRVTLRVDFVLSYACAIAAAIILRTGWVGQLRAAFVTLTLVLVGAIGLRQVAPAVLARGDLLGDPAKRDQDYVASRTLFSRRAYDVDAMRLASDSLGPEPSALTDSVRPRRIERAPVATLATLGDDASLWDRTALGQALGDASAASADRPAAEPATSNRLVDAAPVGWTIIDHRLTGLVVRRPVASSERWRLFVADATRPVLRDSTLDLAPADDDARGAWPLVGPGLEGARLLTERAASDVPAPSLASRRQRLAHAWALRDADLLAADSGETHAPVLVTHRDVRDRLTRLAPIFVQGADVLPVRHEERLYWAVQLYSVSDHYPLSQRWAINDHWYGYFKLAATALVDATTGRVQLVPSARPDAITRTWMTRLPVLFTPVSALPPGLADQLPPATESAAAQIRTFARFGSRLDGPTVRHLPDSLLARTAPAPYVVRDGAAGAGILAWSVPLLDETEELDGVAVVTGGAARTTWWHPTSAPSIRWRSALEALQASDDTVATPAATAKRDARRRRGPVQALMTTRGPLLMQVTQTTRADGTPAIARVALTDGQHTGAGGTLAAALVAIGERPSGGVPPAAASGSVSSDGEAARLYDVMRRAMQRGDWTAFGAAFDSLGSTLRRPPP